MPRSDCEDCKGTGEIEVESVRVDRGRMIDGKFKFPCQGLGDWHMAQCPCVGEEDD